MRSPLLFLLFILTFNLFSQEKIIKGIVSDEFGNLPGVSVVIEGTTEGIETDENGYFIIKAKPENVIAFYFASYKTVKLNVKDLKEDEELKVTMAEN